MNTLKYDETAIAVPTTDIFLELFLEMEAQEDPSIQQQKSLLERISNDDIRTTFSRTLLVTTPC
jgi:hypothetical protein